ncbi:MAG: metal-sulfur cluster assembly factor [Nostocales cyanobacterium W4_Combined_metabat2_030]|nr:metal-sulfur cluster assembly factor [Nostocales cyanobacterium W4_Combined_metabat2_030]
MAEESILAALRQVRDPELMVNIVDLGLIYGIEVEEIQGKSNVKVIMTMTTPACPFGPELVREVKEVLAGIENIKVPADVTISIIIIENDSADYSWNIVNTFLSKSKFTVNYYLE